MSDLNYVLLTGVLKAEPDECFGHVLLLLSSKTELQGEPVVWNEFSVWTQGTVAQACARHLHKGMQIRVVGRLNGQHIDAEHVEFAAQGRKN